MPVPTRAGGIACTAAGVVCNYALRVFAKEFTMKMLELAMILAAPQIATRDSLDFQGKVDFITQAYMVIREAAKKNI